MADENRRLIDAIQTIAGTNKPSDNTKRALARVTAVDVPTRTCTVDTLTGTIFTLNKVALMAQINDGFLMVPAIDSEVIVLYGTQVKTQVIMYSELQRVYAIVGDSGFEMLPDKVMFNDGSYGGMVIIEELVKRLNALEEDNNKLKKALGIVFTPPDLPTVAEGVTDACWKLLKDNLLTYTNQEIEKTKKDDLENKTVLHGKLIPTPQ